MAFTSVQISREASKLLDDAAGSSGLRKGYLADTAIKYFLDPENNPGIKEALASLTTLRERAEQEFLERVFTQGPGK
jgi:hypothetical protein